MHDDPFDAPPPDEQIHAQRYVLGHSKWWPVLAGALVGLLLRIVFNGTPGRSFSPMLGSFMYGAPIASAAISTWMCGEERRARLTTCMYVGALSSCLVVLGALLIAIEGWICAILIFPVFAAIGMLTGLLMGLVYQRMDKDKARHSVYSLALIPLCLGAVEPSWVDTSPQYHTTERKVFIAAPPEVVWNHVTNTSTIEDQHFASSYSLRVGAPVPLQATSVQRSDGTWERQMRWTKGVHFYGDVYDWQPNERMRWAYRFTSDAFPAGSMDEHVTLKSSYFELLDGSYTLTRKDKGTELTEVTHWRLSTPFNGYASFLGEAFIGDTVGRILKVMKERSEKLASP